MIMVWRPSPDTRERLRACLEGGQRRADRSGREQLVALRVATAVDAATDDGPLASGLNDPLVAFEAWEGRERFFWERPAESHSMAARGVVRAIETTGAHRFAEADRRACELFSQLRVGGDRGSGGAGPLLVGGFAFADAGSPSPEWQSFPAGRLVLPEILVVRRAGRAWCTVCRSLSPGGDVEAEWAAFAGSFEQVFEQVLSPRHLGSRSAARSVLSSGFHLAGPGGLSPGLEYRVRADRSHADYCAQVGAAIDSIAAGELEKVVLARSLWVGHDGRFELGRFLDNLRHVYPSCVSFAVNRNGDAFVGATPESLVKLEGDRVAACALAGSAPRGRSPEQDAALGRRLLESKKDQEEHAVVVRVIRSTLEPVCDELQVSEAPGLMRVEGIQHLCTRVEGRLRRDAGQRPSLLALVAALHPTPAVGGAPRREALEWIERCEGMERGWYTGPVGWIDAEGGGEFQVALRSGLILGGAQGDRARLFAGAGIVAGSDPESELLETRLKLRALLAPLTEI
jgi:isochorismate synthase